MTVEGANFTYTPKENAAGGDSFTYSAANSAGAVSLPATVTVTIEAAPALPTRTPARPPPPPRRI